MGAHIELSDIQSWEYVNEPTVYDVCVADNHNYFIDAGKPILVHNSSKTYSIMQVLFNIACTIKPPATDNVITIASESIPNLKKGAYRIAKTIFNGSPELQKYIKTWNETDRIIYFHNGWQMEFNSYENEQQAKQGKRQYLFINECQAVPWPVFWQLAKKTRVRTFLDYNPTAPFWAHDNLIGTTPETNELAMSVQLIISDHRHNPFLSEREHARTEGIKDKQRWLVYARGITGNTTGIIFPDWQRIPDDKFPWDEPSFYGADFGHTNDPTAIVRCARVGESIFLHELCYEPGIPPLQLKQLLFAQKGFTSDVPVYCEHDPDQVIQMRRLGILALPAKKGPGSKNAQIQKAKEYNIFYTASSANLHEERIRYQWITDPDSGKPTNTPIDKWNHAIDATMYAIYTHFYR